MGLYSLSDELKDSVAHIACEIQKQVPGISLQEYITLPDYGQRIVLRFDIDGEIASLQEADDIEGRLRKIIGVDYWVVLVGKVYRKFGFASQMLMDKLENIDKKIPDKILEFPETIHSKKLKEDADKVREILKLPDYFLIWEIEMSLIDNPKTPLFRIVNLREYGHGPSEKYDSYKVKIGNRTILVEFLKNNSTFMGLLKAYISAQRAGVSLISYILNFEKLFPNHSEETT